MNKTTELAGKSKNSLHSPASIGEKAEAIAGAWAEARLVYPLYFFLAAHFHLAMPPVNDAALPSACPATGLFEQVIHWLDEMDAQVRTNQLRQLLHSLKDVRPESLRALILRLLRHNEKSATDRDNIDLLLATYFALCAPEDLYACEITLSDVAQVLQSVLIDADPTELEWCQPLNQVLDAMKACRGLHDVFAAKLLEKGRELKDAAGFMFYDPAALVSFTRFNFLVRRSFFRLLHADLRAIREGLTELERRGISTVDCRTGGLSEQEPVSHLREISLAWRQPISADYAAESANRTFEQLLAIRSAVERALGIMPSEAKLGMTDPAAAVASPTRLEPLVSPPSAAPERKSISPGRSERGRAPSAQNSVLAPPEIRAGAPSASVPPRPSPISPVVPVDSHPAQRAVPPSTVAPKRPSASLPSLDGLSTAVPPKMMQHAIEQRPATSGTAVLSPDLEKCLEGIWEQLIEAPPARGRSMSTVTLGEARILLSAWEVNAFVSDGGQLSEDLRRAVAARALVALAREQQKASGDPAMLNAALALGREEMKYLQSRVDQAQRTKNTEAAVNLGISARRLLSAIEEAQS